MQPRFKDPYARALVAGRPHVIGSPYLVADRLRPRVMLLGGSPGAAGSLARQGPGPVRHPVEIPRPTVPGATVIGSP
jgi:hypothetical protein